MKNKVYLFLFLCCLGNFLFANTDKHLTNEAYPSLIETTELTTTETNETALPFEAMTLVMYDLDDCASFPNDGSSRDFSELQPAFPNPASCSTVNATVVSRTGSSHSCMAGADGSTAGMCVPVDGRSSFRINDDDAIRFDVTVSSSSTGSLTELKFYEQSPTNFLHLSGNSGRNDYAREFGVRILKDGNEIFRQTDLSTSQNGWRLERFDFSNNNNFSFSGTATFSFEILGYNPVDNNGGGSFFDIDEIMISGSCDPCGSQGGDSDGDGICDFQDNCDFNPNPDQADSDGDGIGNACDSTPNGNPCANQGGDSDGDGVCDFQDNCDFNANPDQADNDGDGIGNVCDSTPNGGGTGGGGGDCNSVTVVGESGKVTITNIPSDAIVEILGPSTGFGQQLVCSGNCSSMEMVNNLSAGDYNVTIQTFNPYCFNRVTVTVTGGGSGGGGGNPCDGQGGDSDGDGVCDFQDNCDFNANPDQADNDGDGIGNACDSTPNGGGTGGGGGDCNSVTVVGESGKITITNIPSDAKIEFLGPSTGFGQRLVCEGNCSSMEMINDLGAGDYNVTIQTFNPYCFNRVTVTVTGGGGGGGNPCDGQGGDSDGDGICDFQDNCDFNANPDQADNDGDGIGNACDSTPNGNPCANQGGDSDGDGICDFQDNCDFNANPNQADNDGDGIGNACDDTPNGGPSVCADRTVINTTLCRGDDAGIRYGGFLLIDRVGNPNFISNNHFDFQNGQFVEFTDGTARLTGRWVNVARSSVQFDVDIQFSGITTNERGTDHVCLDNFRGGLYFYTNTSGTLTGRGDLEGAILGVSRASDAFQVGIGGNITDVRLVNGASGWISINIQRQPTTGINITIGNGSSGQNGDININLSGSAETCSPNSSRTVSYTHLTLPTICSV